MSTPYTYEDYRRANLVLWGEDGAWLVDEFRRLNARYFSEALRPMPIVLGLSAYGRCLGSTRAAGEWGRDPRISIATQYLKRGRNDTSDTLLHEMIHALLLLRGENSKHNGKPWCREITRLTLLLGLPPINAAPVNTRWVKDRKDHARLPLPGYLSRTAIARWPHSRRSADYQHGEPLSISTY